MVTRNMEPNIPAMPRPTLSGNFNEFLVDAKCEGGEFMVVEVIVVDAFMMVVMLCDERGVDLEVEEEVLISASQLCLTRTLMLD